MTKYLGTVEGMAQIAKNLTFNELMETKPFDVQGAIRETGWPQEAEWEQAEEDHLKRMFNLLCEATGDPFEKQVWRLSKKWPFLRRVWVPATLRRPEV